MRMQEAELQSHVGKDFLIASLFNLCLDLFGAGIPSAETEEQIILTEEKHRLLLWAGNFEGSLDELLIRKNDERMGNLIVMLLGCLMNTLHTHLHTRPSPSLIT